MNALTGSIMISIAALSGAFGFAFGFASVGAPDPQIVGQTISAIDQRARADDYSVCARAARLFVDQRSKPATSADLNLKAFFLRPFLDIQGRNYCLRSIVALQQSKNNSLSCKMADVDGSISDQFAACLLGYRFEKDNSETK